MPDLEELKFCVKYPFTDEAKKYVEGIDLSKISDDTLAGAVQRIEKALADGTSSQRDKLGEIESSKKEDYLKETLFSYPISKILISLSDDILLKRKYASSISKGVSQFLQLEKDEVLLKVAKQLFKLKTEGGRYKIPLNDYLSYLPDGPEFKLINAEMGDGEVFIDKHGLSKVISNYVYESIMKTRVERAKMPKMFIYFADELAKKYRTSDAPMDLGPVDFKSFPPCMRKICSDLLNPDTEVGHQARFVVATFFANINMDLHKAADFFRLQSDFNEAKTLYYLEHAYGKRGGKRKYSVPSCDKMKSYGLDCYEESRCPYKTPLVYYKSKKKVSEPRRRLKK